MADAYRYLELDEFETETESGALGEWAEKRRGQGYSWTRLTIVSPEHPNADYPDGVYIELWKDRPADEGEFNFPLAELD